MYTKRVVCRDMYTSNELFKMKFLICVLDLIPTVPSSALNDKGAV